MKAIVKEAYQWHCLFLCGLNANAFKAKPSSPGVWSTERWIIATWPAVWLWPGRCADQLVAGPTRYPTWIEKRVRKKRERERKKKMPRPGITRISRVSILLSQLLLTQMLAHPDGGLEEITSALPLDHLGSSKLAGIHCGIVLDIHQWNTTVATLTWVREPWNSHWYPREYVFTLCHQQAARRLRR